MKATLRARRRTRAMGNRDVSDEVLRAFAVGRIFILETLSAASFGSKVAVTNVAIGSMDRQRVDF